MNNLIKYGKYNRRILDQAEYPFFSEKYNIFFIHIPKNAGSSVVITLDIPKSGAHGSHRTYKELRSELGTTLDRFPSFAIVRNPWDRMVSIFKYRKKNNYLHHISPDCTFEEWLFHPNTPQCSGHMEFANQIGCLIDGKHSVTDCLRYEYLEEDWSLLSKKYNLPKKLPTLNASPGDAYESYYTPQSIDFVSNLFKADINYFGYEFKN